MAQRFYGLPPMTSLAVFEAAARHMSFTLAAAELNLTPGAVSRQVRAPEDDLPEGDLKGPPFLRDNRGVVLTRRAKICRRCWRRGSPARRS